jgi:hypothetical protein
MPEKFVGWLPRADEVYDTMHALLTGAQATITDMCAVIVVTEENRSGDEVS